MCVVLQVSYQIVGMRLKNKYATQIYNKQRPRCPKIQKIEQNLFLAHSRLSIIDLNVRSNQPMKGRDDISYIVFNGEIYNFKELKNTYLNSISFKTQGDTEVLLEGIIKYGFNFLEKIRGFFSFAFYDKKKIKYF